MCSFGEESGGDESVHLREEMKKRKWEREKAIGLLRFFFLVSIGFFILYCNSRHFFFFFLGGKV